MESKPVNGTAGASMQLSVRFSRKYPYVRGHGENSRSLIGGIIDICICWSVAAQDFTHHTYS